MRNSKHVLIALISVAVLVSAVVMSTPTASQADVQFGRVKKILKGIFPLCEPGTKDERFVVKGEKVCDNTTGLWWQKTPGVPPDTKCGNLSCFWADAKAYCEGLNENGAGQQKLWKKYKRKPWRLPEVKELISLVDYSQFALALPENAPFMSVQPFEYWSATELAGNPALAWVVNFNSGNVLTINKGRRQPGMVRERWPT